MKHSRLAPTWADIVHPAARPPFTRPSRRTGRANNDAHKVDLDLLFYLSYVSYNVNGLSAYPTTMEGRLRQKRILDNIRALCKKYDVVCLQETKLMLLDTSFFERIFPNYKIFYSNLRRGKAGVITIVSPTVAKTHVLRQVSLDARLSGYALALHISHPVKGDCLVQNLYLSTGSDHFKRKTDQIRLLNLLTPAKLNISLGDLNFIESKEDTTSRSTFHHRTHSFRKAWDSYILRFGLQEVHQGSHTFFRICDNLELSHSTRLDRIYTSYSESSQSMLHPSADIPHIPYSILSAHRSESAEDIFENNASSTPNRRKLTRALAGSDHLPVGLSFRPPGRPKRTSAPSWTYSDEAFRRLFTEKWATVDTDGLSPFKIDSLFTDALTWSGFAVQRLRSHSKADYVNKAQQISAGLTLLRATSSSSPDHAIVNFLSRKHASLGQLVSLHSNGLYDSSRLEHMLDALIVSNTTQSATTQDFSLPQTNILISNRPNALTEIKDLLPSSKKRITSLRKCLDEEATDDPDTMAELLKDYWGTEIWAKQPSHTPQAARKFFTLVGYERYVRRIPINLLPTIPPLQIIQETIMGTADSSPGPDGIPFSAYRAVSHFFAPVLRAMLTQLAKGDKPPAGFNYGNTFFIPKKGTKLPCDHRPISVTNSNNRLLAKCVVVAITPALQHSLHPDQKGFVEGRSGGDHIRNLNAKFYSHLKKNTQYHILFMDTAKAFDSISHPFIREAMIQIGLPPWVVNVVTGLMHEVKVTPVLGAAHATRIDIRRGVKQGCPLSPLLFAICYDSLLVGLDNFKQSGSYDRSNRPD